MKFVDAEVQVFSPDRGPTDTLPCGIEDHDEGITFEIPEELVLTKGDTVMFRVRMEIDPYDYE